MLTQNLHHMNTTRHDLGLIETVVFAEHFIENFSIVFLKLKYRRQGTTILSTVGPTCVIMWFARLASKDPMSVFMRNLALLLVRSGSTDLGDVLIHFSSDQPRRPQRLVVGHQD